MMLSDNKYSISIVTAIFNGANCLNELIQSLRKQTDKDFEWIVVDGASTDNTLEILKNVNDLNLKIISEPDFGIYDALNKGIRSCNGEFYLVVGSDDILYADAIKEYKKNININVALITGSVRVNGYVVDSHGKAWQFGQSAYISNHSVGVLIRKNLHFKYGWYSKEFPIAADQLFIQKCALGNESILKINALIGEFSLKGISSTNHLGAITELFRIQIFLGYNKWFQFMIYILRVFRQLKG